MKDILAFATVSGFRLEKPTGEDPDRKILPIKAAWGTTMKENNHKEFIHKKEFYRNLARLAFPIALQSLMLASVAAGDALINGTATKAVPFC